MSDADVTDAVSNGELSAGGLRNIVEHVPVGIGVHDPRGRMLSLNAAGLEMHGFETFEALRDTVEHDIGAFELRTLDGQVLPLADWPISRAARGDYVTDLEVVVRRPDGQERVISYTVRPLPLEPGGEQRLVFVLHDVTQRLQAAADLRQVHALIEGVTQGTDDLIAAQDSDYRYIYFNDAYRQVFRDLWGQDLAVGTDMVAALARWPEEQAKARALWSRAHAGESFSVTMPFGPSEAEQRVFDLRFNPVRDAQGRQIAAAHILRDVTESVRMQEALRESEERFRTLADHMSQLCWMADPSGWIFWYNRRWYEYTGTTLEQMQGWGWKQVHHPDHIDRVVKRIQHSWDTGEPWEDTFPLRGRDGGYRWFLSRAVPIRDEAGRIVRWFGTNTDVTDQREAEEALRQSEQRFRRMADTAPAILWITDAAGACTYISRGWEQYTGQSRDDALGLGWAQMVHPDDQAEAKRLFVLANANREPVRLEYRLRQPDGSYRWALDVGQPRFDEQGVFQGFIGSVLDLHDRRESEHRFREIFDNAAVGIVEVSPAGHLVRVNQRFCDIVGYSAERLQAMTFKDLTHPDDVAANMAQFERLVGGETGQYAMRKRYLRPDGQIVWAHLTVTPRRDERGGVRYCVAAVQDISAQVQAERRLQDVNANLEERVRERTAEVRRQSEHVRELSLEVIEAEERERQRLAMVLHDDLQQMLAAVRMRLGMLRAQVPGEKQAMWTQLDELVESSIASTRSLAQEMSPPILHRASLAVALEWLGKQVAAQHALTVHVEADPEATVEAEDVRRFLFRAARELLFNVVKHAEAREAWLKLERDPQGLRLSVTDEGRGCEPTRHDGTGLGLFGLQQRVERLGGWSEISSSPGGGCRVTLAVPVRATADSPESA